MLKVFSIRGLRRHIVYDLFVFLTVVVNDPLHGKHFCRNLLYVFSVPKKQIWSTAFVRLSDDPKRRLARCVWPFLVFNFTQLSKVAMLPRETATSKETFPHTFCRVLKGAATDHGGHITPTTKAANMGESTPQRLTAF